MAAWRAKSASGSPACFALKEQELRVSAAARCQRRRVGVTVTHQGLVALCSPWRTEGSGTSAALCAQHCGGTGTAGAAAAHRHRAKTDFTWRMQDLGTLPAAYTVFNSLVNFLAW